MVFSLVLFLIYVILFTGDRAGAEEASRSARTCNILGTVFGIITIVAVVVVYVVYWGALTTTSYSYSYK